MLDFFRQILSSQYEAGLCMLNQCIAVCPSEHWESKIANDKFRQVAYHTLFFTDLYLSPSEKAFQHHELTLRGGDERGEEMSPGLSREETLDYVSFAREKIGESLNAETLESLQGPSGFSWRKCSRAELHIYNIRHLQHHTGQLSAFLRKVDGKLADPKALPWVGSGWRS
jgi:hypothetical protein